MRDKKLLNVVTYLVKTYPKPDHISNARLTKMIYLADWFHSLNHGKQITQIDWYFDNFGPFVWDVKDVVASHGARFKITDTANMYGTSKTQIALQTNPEVTLPPQERASLDHVIKQTQNLTWSAFIRLVYSTYPIASSVRYSFLNLVQKAREYMDDSESRG